MTTATRLLIAVLALCALAAAVLALRPDVLDRLLVASGVRKPALLTLEQRLALIGPAATERLEPYFRAAGVSYPPASVTLVGLKSVRRLELYARGSDADAVWRFVRAYPVQAASGHLGPKLREGDKQVPEGIYGIDVLNPNSLYNVSMRVTYPNDFDRANAAKDGRSNLGGAIMIHGRAVSVGCLAMGDPASEELFALAAAVGLNHITVVLAPVDFRTEPRPEVDGAPAWIGDLYTRIESALKLLPLPSGTAS